MKSSITTAIILLSGFAWAQEGGQGQETKSDPKEKSAVESAKPKEEKDQASEREAKFKAMLTNATLTGRWCLIKDGKLTPEKEDKYTIEKVTRITAHAWLIHTRIQYGKHDFVAPVPVQVQWAGDTPMIILDKIPIPGSGTFSARVLFHEDSYAGTWSGGDHAGLLSGMITREKESAPAKP